MTTRDPCECEAGLYVAGEQGAIPFPSGKPWGFRCKTVDMEETPKAAKEPGIRAVPVVCLRDGEGRQVTHFEESFPQRGFYPAWEAYLSGEAK
ncbi:MAG: hypothetical protein Kow0092_39530 [Deferrisomatales bacterium]